MVTADEIRAQITAAQQDVEASQAEHRNALRVLDEATERQRLRRELESLQEKARFCRRSAQTCAAYAASVDSDVAGRHVGSNTSDARKSGKTLFSTVNHGEVDCSAAVVNGELEWSIKGFSWLKDMLMQREEAFEESPSVDLGDHRFCLAYYTIPLQDEWNQRGSLLIEHSELKDGSGVAFRYEIWIKSKSRGYVQWGDAGSICESGEPTDGKFYGPDVTMAPGGPVGVFGMSHEELLTSDWVIDDALHVKLKLAVRPNVEGLRHESQESDSIVPPSSLNEDLIRLLDTGATSDVTFVVQGEPLRAHSSIISCRSQVFERQFACGMQESSSKEVTIEDSDPKTFLAFLRYLYSDSLSVLESFVTTNDADQTSPVLGQSAAENPMPKLQGMLALSHKYQMARLQLWCEHEVSKHISVEKVCSVLCQAHLYEAKELEKRCLNYIRSHMEELAKLDAFAMLNREWPEVSLKVTLHIGGVSDSAVAAAVQKQQCARKRKRDD